VDTPRPPPRTNRTRRVPHPVLIGHAASLTPYQSDTPPSPRRAVTRATSPAAAQVTSEGVYEHLSVELERKRIPQQSPRELPPPSRVRAPRRASHLERPGMPGTPLTAQRRRGQARSGTRLTRRRGRCPTPRARACRTPTAGIRHPRRLRSEALRGGALGVRGCGAERSHDVHDVSTAVFHSAVRALRSGSYGASAFSPPHSHAPHLHTAGGCLPASSEAGQPKPSTAAPSPAEPWYSSSTASAPAAPTAAPRCTAGRASAARASSAASSAAARSGWRSRSAAKRSQTRAQAHLPEPGAALGTVRHGARSPQGGCVVR